MSRDPLWEFLAASWRDHVLIYFVATWSGLVTSLHRLMTKKTSFSLISITVDVLLSGMTGIFVYWVCNAMLIEPPWTAVAAGIAGHSAPRTLWLLERKMRQLIGNYS